MREAETRSRPLARSLRGSLTKAEAVLWAHIRRGALNGWKFRRQHPVGPYVADFACVPAGLIVEVDGATHSTSEQQARDARRTAYLQERGWRVFRVLNTDVYENLDGVMRGLAAALPPLGASDHCLRERGETPGGAGGEP